MREHRPTLQGPLAGKNGVVGEPSNSDGKIALENLARYTGESEVDGWVQFHDPGQLGNRHSETPHRHALKKKIARIIPQRIHLHEAFLEASTDGPPPPNVKLKGRPPPPPPPTDRIDRPPRPAPSNAREKSHNCRCVFGPNMFHCPPQHESPPKVAQGMSRANAK